MHKEQKSRFCGTTPSVPEKGVEPLRPCGQRILSPPWLPLHHSGIVEGIVRIPSENTLLTLDDLLDLGFQTLDLVVVSLHRLLLVALGF